MTRRGNAPGLLSVALDQAAELPEESGPLGHDAAVLAISGATLGLDEALRDSRPLQRQALARKLRGEAEQSHDPQVVELGDFVAGQLSGTVPRIEVAADLPWLMRTEGVQPTLWRSRGARGDIHSIESAAGQYGLRPVLPILTSRAYGISHLPELSSGDSGPASFNLTGQAGIDDLAEIMMSGSPAAVPEPPEPADQLNVGLVRADRPDRPIIRGVVRTGTDHLVWVSIGPPDADAVPGDRKPLNLESVPDADLLTVLIFPDQALTVPSAPCWGTFVMGPDRPLRVLRPAEQPAVPAERLDSRLYFTVRTPDQPGSHDVRILVYHRNVLLQARRLTLPVGGAGTRLSVRTTYTLVRSPTAASVRELTPRRLCLYVNQSDNGSHQLCFSAQDGAELKYGRLTLEPDEVAGLFDPIRRGLRLASWQSADAWNPQLQHAYRYEKRENGRFAADVTQLEQDLFRLAKIGYEAWNTLTLGYLISDPDGQGPGLPPPDVQQEDWQRLMRPPGIIQVAPAQGSKLVPPLAGLYDLDLDTELPASKLRLCPRAATLLRAGGDVAALECFEDGCPEADDHTVCPSGFWGLRHEITVPPSLGQAAGTTFRTEAGPRTALVGTMPEHLLRGVTAHADKVRARFGPDNSRHVWSREDWFEAASQPGQRTGCCTSCATAARTPKPAAWSSSSTSRDSQESVNPT